MCNVDLVRAVKEGGGHRPTRKLPALYRIWGRIRRGVCDEANKQDSCDFAAAGQTAQRAAWDVAKPLPTPRVAVATVFPGPLVDHGSRLDAIMAKSPSKACAS